MAERGWLGSTLPQQYGGLGLSFSEWAVIPEALGSVLAPEPINEVAILGGGVLRRAGGSVAADILPKLAAGEIIPALAWQESSGSYDPEAVGSRVAAGPRGLSILNGTKSYVPYAHAADGFVVSARNGEGLALYWVPANSPGLELSFHPLADGSLAGRIAFNQVPLRASQRICAGKTAVSALVASLDETAVMVSMSLVGLMNSVLLMTTAYMKSQIADGASPGRLQALQNRAADLYIKRELSRVAVGDALVALDNESDLMTRSVAASRAKARCSDAALQICRDAIQLHGTVGCTDKYDLGLYLHRSLVLSAWLGNSAYHRRRFAALQRHSSGEHPS